MFPKVICAWCSIVLRAGALPASHGICPGCVEQFEAPRLPCVLHVTYPSGREVTIGFPTPFDRGLHMILLAAQPVTLRPEDREAA